MKYKVNDIIRLKQDLEDLRKGQPGVIVEIYPPAAYEVEFIQGDDAHSCTTLTLSDDLIIDSGLNDRGE